MAIQTDPQFKIRLPEDLKKRLQDAADANTRTLTAEILHRLERSFDEPVDQSRLQGLYDKAAKLQDDVQRLMSMEAFMRRALENHGKERGAAAAKNREKFADSLSAIEAELETRRSEYSSVLFEIGALKKTDGQDDAGTDWSESEKDIEPIRPIGRVPRNG